MGKLIGRGQMTITDLNDVIASSTPPANPSEGSLWYNEDDGALYVYNNGSWVLASPELQIGGRNLVINSTFNNGTVDWTNSYEILTPEDDKPTSSILRIASAGYTSPRYAQTWSKEIPMSINPKNTFTLSFDIKIDDLSVLADTDTVFSIRTFSEKGKVSSADATWEKTIRKSDLTDKVVNSKWYRYSVTFESVASQYIRVAPYLTMNGVVYYREIKLEVGNVATDWTPSPEDVTTKLISITETLGNMTNDNIIDYSERQIIKEKISDILGYVISDTEASLPTPSFNDSATNGKGSFYYVRKNATMSGLLTTNSSYVNVETQYSNLKAYLEGLTPIKPWDVSETNKDKIITIDKAVFRDQWLQYYKAEQDLANATADQLKKNVDNVTIGGTNLASNGNFEYDIKKSLWSGNYVGELAEVVDISTETPPFKYAFHVKNTANALGGINNAVLWSNESANAMTDREITISYWLKYQNIEQGGTDAWNAGRFGEIVIEGEDDSGNKYYSYPKIHSDNTVTRDKYITGSDMVWKKYYGTIKLSLPTNATKLKKISFKHEMYLCTGEFWTTGIKIETGNKVTDWSSCPADINSRITNVEFKVSPQGIYTTMMASEAFNATLGADVGDYKFENGVTAWKQNKELTEDVTGVEIVKGQSSSGSNVIQISGEKWLFYNRKIPIETSHVYKIRFRVRQVTDSTTDGTARVSAGVACYDANKSPLVAQTFGIHRFCAVADQNIYVADGWLVYEGTITNEGNDSYGQFIEGTHYATPVLIVNYSGGDGVAQVDYCEIQDITDLDALAVQVSNLQQSITPEGISTVIESSQFYENYTNALKEKANAEDVSNNYVSNDKLTNAIDNIDITGQITNMADDENSALRQKFSTKLEMEETARGITDKFSATGGSNLLKNSVGFADFISQSDAENGINQNWFVLGKTERMQRIQTTQLDSLGFGSGFQFVPANAAGNNTSIDQYVTVIPNQVYTLSWYINKTNASDASTADGAVDIFMLESDETTMVNLTYKDSSGNLVSSTKRRYNSEYVTEGYESGTVTFTPTTNRVRLRVYGCNFSEAILTGFMFTIGDIPLQWSLATGENYNTNVRIDINGIRVSMIETDSGGNKVERGFTSITPTEFAGWYDTEGDGTFEKIFYLNGDETVSKRLRALEEITMGTIKVVKVPMDDGSTEAGEPVENSGWAFIPNR
ncbi:hypothetical protein [Bacillus mojavensis]